jgi:hypothetical protein
MLRALSLCLFAAASAAAPMLLNVERGFGELTVRFELLEPLPEAIQSAVSSGVEVHVRYPIRVYSRRRMWWDNRIWKGEARTTTTFDAITGRYQCSLTVNGETTVSRELDSAEEAMRWLTAPPPLTLPLPPARQNAHLRVEVRAVFASGTKWLVFPSTDGTKWVVVRLEAPREKE